MSGPFGASQFMYATSSSFYGHEISHSIRFDDGSSEYLSRTPGSAGNRKTMTWSGWFKRSALSGHQRFFGAGVDNYVSFTSAGAIEINLRSGGSTSNAFVVTDKLHRDVSAWYHIVVAIDTTQGTDTNRVKVYVNGVQETSFDDYTAPSQNNDLNSFNNTVEQFIGRYSSGNYYDGYMAEVHFIDGLALTPASFGETKNDIWIPKNTSGLTYGTQGFRLQFKQAGLSANASGLGADTSGNTNHLNSVNHAAHDRVLDSPTNNFATLNSLDIGGSNATYSEADLKIVTNSGSNSQAVGTIPIPSTGKWYWEVLVQATSGTISDNSRMGIQVSSNVTPSLDVRYNSNGNKSVNNSGSSYGASYAAGDIISVAVNADDNEVTFFKDGSTQGAISYTMTANETYLPIITEASSTINITYVANFGQDSSFAGNATAQNNADDEGIGDFFYSPPSSFLTLCTANLPAPVATIDPAQGGSPQDYFNTLLRNGTGSGGSVTGVGFQPDWYWEKKRNASSNHYVVDSVRGVTKSLFSNLTNTEGTDTNSIQSFDTDGFTWGSDDRGADENLVVWLWKAGTAFSNDASATSVGSIDSSGSVNTDVGFSIISYTGTGSNATVAHGLSKAPELYIVKSRTSPGGDWKTYSEKVGNSFQGFLEGSGAFENTGSAIWQNTSPTSSVFSIGTNAGVNNSGTNFIAYLFHAVNGYSHIDIYTGNGNADGAFAYTGFRPAWVIIKSLTSETGWRIYDSKRLGFNVTNNVLYSNDSGGEDAANDHIDLLSNGFKMRRNNVSNTNGVNYLYMAFAEQPFKYANAR